MLVTFHHGGDEVSLQPVATRASRPVVVLVVLVEDVFLDIYSLFYMGLHKHLHSPQKGARRVSSLTLMRTEVETTFKSGGFF